ncbi:hypothetical protein QMK19_06950 [Streptomyces sp. H10-C2]|uniref:hypothetical protein n=1 Tax=unclassified Streptomyces TaxID=2593676 RepID=UPI0024BBBE8F|nr:MULTISPECIES: hypothetical protein [unclassified Streptomyces]MDJ0341229.1 hypothetical protein [Streptomyces sp. PH10-H1]MDJ0369418.1 hypothetical protein [Streptomyces sp. H10-C2]
MKSQVKSPAKSPVKSPVINPLESAVPAPVEVEEAEASIVENYPHLVRLAYLTLPAGLGRHRRLLAAHTLVQRALPRGRRAPDPVAADAAGPRGGTPDPAYALVRQEVLRRAVAYGEETGWRRRARAAGTWLPLPHVWGLRLHPKAGGTDELALDRSLSELGSSARAAFALSALEGLADREVREVLAAAGVADPRAAAVDAAAASGEGGEGGERLQALLGGGEFDPCTVQARPTDLLRRRQHVRAGTVTAAAVVVAAVLLSWAGADGGPAPYAAAGTPAGSANPLEPTALARAGGTLWQHTSRMDFTAWPARGGRLDDTELLRRALAVWSRPGERVQVSATPGTSRGLPAQPPQLLYAGDVGQAAVVVLYDGMRIVRYAEPHDGEGSAALDFARVDDADVTTGAAVVVGRADGDTRYLTAPWVDDAQTRDLLQPNRPGQPLRVAADGVTDPVRTPGAGAAAGACGTAWPVLQFRSSAKIVEQHSFLLTDLGDLTPVHLTYTPPPGGSAPDRQPREATGSQALLNWAHSACRLGTLRGQGVRAVDNWEFAEQRLPEGGASASWVCTRADTWRGPGRAIVQFQSPDAPATDPGAVAAQAENTSACSRFGQHVLAGVMWKSPAGHWYLLAAGSRDVTRVAASGGVHASVDGPLLAVRADRGADARLTARLTTGGTLDALR